MSTTLFGTTVMHLRSGCIVYLIYIVHVLDIIKWLGLGVEGLLIGYI